MQSRTEAAAVNLIAQLRKAARKGRYEWLRNDWYGWAHVTPGRPPWIMDQELDEVIRMAKDIAAIEEFELVYVYWAPPVWTTSPSDVVRDKAEQMEFIRQASAVRRWERCSPPGSINETIANVAATNIESLIGMLKVPEEPPSGDPVITRIQALGIANYISGQ